MNDERARNELDRWRQAVSARAFAPDPALVATLQRLLGQDLSTAGVTLRLDKVASAGPDLDLLVREDNRDENLPVVRRHDAHGHPTEEVVFHPAHHEIGRAFWGSEVLSVLAEPGNETLAGAIAYLLDHHGEAGHACPVACTAGAIKLIQSVGSADQQQRYLPSLLEPSYERRVLAAQFVTEVQGGSDVGANSCTATPDRDRPGWWRLNGEKWFCSVADADLFVVSARPDDGPDGTRGLGLFLVPRVLEGRPNGFTLRRLKYKLGTRSMPTGEIELDGALAEPIGPLENGFKNLVSVVLDTSRVHNALAACGIMHRSLVEAEEYARHRHAFGQPIAVYPAVQEILARMNVSWRAALASTFAVLETSDAISTGAGSGAAPAARRIAVMINKYTTAVAATAVARDGIEMLGGNGTIEDFSPLPRLYRDAIVVESWEGTHNTLCAQVLRDFATRSLHRPWLEEVRAKIDRLSTTTLGSLVDLTSKLFRDVDARIQALLTAEPSLAAAHIRTVVDHMCRLTDVVELARQLEWERHNGVDTGLDAVVELYRLERIEHVDPQAHPELIELRKRVISESG